MKYFLDIGCGSNKYKSSTEKVIGIDISKYSDADVICDVFSTNFPFESNIFDRARAIQLVEHIPRVSFIKGKMELPFINFMNELYRVVKHEGIIEIHTPIPNRNEFYQDPTHVNPVVTQTWKYFNPHDEFGLKDSYGIDANLVLISSVRKDWYRIYKLMVVKEKFSEIDYERENKFKLRDKILGYLFYRMRESAENLDI